MKFSSVHHILTQSWAKFPEFPRFPKNMEIFHISGNIPETLKISGKLRSLAARQPSRLCQRVRCHPQPARCWTGSSSQGGIRPIPLRPSGPSQRQKGLKTPARRSRPRANRAKLKQGRICLAGWNDCRLILSAVGQKTIVGQQNSKYVQTSRINNLVLKLSV